MATVTIAHLALEQWEKHRTPLTKFIVGLTGVTHERGLDGVAIYVFSDGSRLLAYGRGRSYRVKKLPPKQENP